MTKLSARQFSMLEMFISQKELYITEVQKMNQLTFGSIYHRGYIAFKKLTRTFLVTDKGLDAFKEFHETNIYRQNIGGPFTHYFPSPLAKPIQSRPAKQKIHIIREARRAS